MNKQDTRITELERQGWTFEAWTVDVVNGEETRTALMTKRHRHGSEYCEVDTTGDVR